MRLCRNVPSTCCLAITLIVILGSTLVAPASVRAESPPPSQAAESQLPEAKRTTLALYATAAEAYAAWDAAPDEVTIFDVRTPEEFMFVGHPAMAWNIPVFMQTWDWDSEKGRYSMVPNSDFVSSVTKIADPADKIFLMCRSGGRSAMAVDLLAEAGFTNVYTIVDGMEGSKDKDSESPDHGHRTVNGWKNSGLPWTYDVDPERMALPEAP
jgi:rhodanese-related sulfurtransferase